MTVDRWIAEVVPLARATVNWAEPIVDNEISVCGVGRDPDQGLHGPFMLTWFEDRVSRPKIYYLREHAFYLSLSEMCFQITVGSSEVVRESLADGSRMRLAVTNDVLQVMAPTPPGKYSMVRHHALMLLAATLWLPEAQRARWLTIYDASLAAVLGELQTTSDVGKLLLGVESTAFDVFKSGRTLGTGEHGLVGAIGSEALSNIARYMLYSNAAVGILAHKMHQAGERGWTNSSWLAQEVTRYRSDYYLLQEFDELRK